MAKQTFFPSERLEDSIQVMRMAVAEGLRDPQTRVLAAKIIRGCVARDDLCEMQSVWNFLKEHVKYVADPVEVDTFSTLKRTLELGIGDCDDMVVAATTLLTVLGFPAFFRVYRTSDSASWNHVGALVGIPKTNHTGVIPFDLTLDDPQLNKEINAQFVTKHKDFPAVVGDWSALTQGTAQRRAS